MNPYKVLGIDHRASKRDILHATALAMRARKYSGQQIAMAQKELMDPVARAVHDFIHVIDVKPILERLALVCPEPTPAPQLPYLNPFDENS